jgi:membrane-bound lytic murein transglycosylase D
LSLYRLICVLALLAGMAACAPLPSQRSVINMEASPATQPLERVSIYRPSAPNRPGTEPSSELENIGTEQLTLSHVAPLSAPVDLWDRMRRGFAMPDLDTDLVRDRERWYTARPETITRLTERSRKYLFHVVEELERRNMPTELALLPFVESAFNPNAVSSAKAAGMWQFIPSTGKSFDLKQNAFRDDRRDVLASTRAALDYLQRLHGMFGDWQLALAAYNWGEGSVGRAMAKQQKLGGSVAYADLPMPMETRFYVPKLQALKNIVAQPGQFGVKLPDIGNHPFFDTVTVTRDIDVTLAAKLAEVSLDDFKSLNPSFNRPVIMASGTPQILLPWDNATLFVRNLDAYAGSTASWMVWVAPSTMKAADVAKRVGMSEAELRSVNNIPTRMMVGAGSMLVVPRPAHVVNDVVATVADAGQVSLAPESVPRRPVPRKGKAAGGKTQAVAKTGTGNKSTVATNKNKASPNLVAKR